MNILGSDASGVNTPVPSFDEMTFLEGHVSLAKRISFADGVWTKHDAPPVKHFNVAVRKVRNLDDVAHHVATMGEAGAIAIHGRLAKGVDAFQVLRRKTNFDTVAHRWVAVDLDKLDGQADPAAAAADARALLPEQFHRAACIWQASAGHALKPGKVRLRLWFWCDKPIALVQLAAWLKGSPAQPDLALWRVVQPIYLGVRVDGAPDPVKRRLGKLLGAAEVVVPPIDAAAVAEVARKQAMAAGTETDSPWMVTKSIGLLRQRHSDDIVARGGRHMSLMGAANDFFDRAVSEHVTLAVLSCWTMPEDDAERDLAEALAECGVRDAADQARQVRQLGEKTADTWAEGDETIDYEVVERMIGDALAARGTEIGSEWKRDPSSAFAVPVADPDEPPQVVGRDPLGAWLDAVNLGTAAEAKTAHEAVVVAVTGNGLTVKQKGRLDTIIAEIEAGTFALPVPDGIDGLRKLVAPPPPAPVYESRAAVRTRSATAVRWIVDHLIAAESLFVIHGREKTGKSLIATDIVYSAGYGRAWGGRAVKRTGVLYVCPEGPHGFALRQDAWHNRQAGLGLAEDDGPIEIRRVATDLYSSDKDLNAIVEQVRTFKARHGIECGLVIFDTFRACAPGADENSARDVGVFTARLTKLRDMCRCAVGYVHHDGKDVARGASGSTAHLSNVDSVFATYKDKGALVFRPELQRDTGDMAGVRFRIEEHDARVIEGKMERAAVAVVIGKATGARPSSKDEADRADLAVEGEGGGLSPDEIAQCEVVLAHLKAEAGTEGVGSTDLNDAVNDARRVQDRKSKNVNRTDFRALLSKLKAEGSIRSSGKAKATKYHLPEGV